MASEFLEANAESQSQGAGGAKDGTPSGEAKLPGQGGIGGSRQESEHVGVRAVGTVRPWGAIPNPVTGGIIAQLIAQVEDQLGEARACVEWYERSVEKYTRQLENLKRLKELADLEAQGTEE